MAIHFDCKYFKGFMPCVPNKEKNVICDSCNVYKPVSKKILIIKLGAIGDVIRTTPLIQKYRNLYPDCHITWITLFPDVLPKTKIDFILKLDAISIFKIQNETFDIAINLDKDKESCMLLSCVIATEKYGFTFENNHISCATENAKHKLITGLFDQKSKENKKSYLEEIFEICHLKFEFEEYQIQINESLQKKWNYIIKTKASNKTIIGLNTGCGERWKTRLWDSKNWISLIKKLEKNNFFCVLLGGKNEDEINQRYEKETGAYYPGHFSLEEFIALSTSVDIVVTQVSMMMHIATALRKKMILMNNIFNPHEFELYRRGVIVQPKNGCDCYYGNTCIREISCMSDIYFDDIYKNIQNFVN